jgi:hypothetical protein
MDDEVFWPMIVLLLLFGGLTLMRIFKEVAYLFVIPALIVSFAIMIAKPEIFSGYHDQTRTPNSAPTKGGYGNSTGVGILRSAPPPIVVPNLLYHGTKSLVVARDILEHNRWKAFATGPSGIYMGDFRTAASYVANDGAVVEVQVSIPAYLAVNYREIQRDPRYLSWLQQYTGDASSAESVFALQVMGKRLIKQLNAYIVPTPITQHINRYYRVEGIIPLRLLDRNMKQIVV